MHRRLRAGIAGLALALLAGPAFAHAHLVSSTPAADSSVASLAAIVLDFSEPIEPGFTGLVLTGPDGRVVGTGPTEVGPAGPAAISVSIASGLASGSYEVSWHAVAVDGHKTSGSFDFTVAP